MQQIRCPRCDGHLALESGGEESFCLACGFRYYPHSVDSETAQREVERKQQPRQAGKRLD